MTNAPGSAPDTNPPERPVDTLSAIRERMKVVQETGAEVSEDIVNSALTALRDAREQVKNMSGEALDGLKTEVAKWRLDEVPDALRDAVEATQLSIDSIYQRFQDNTVLFAQDNIEKGMGAVTKITNMLMETADKLQNLLAKMLGPLLPSLMSFGITVPDWLLPKGPGMKELFAALSANKRTFEAGSKDDENMREVVKILSSVNSGKVAAQQIPLASFLISVVEQSPSNKQKLTTKDILESAQKVKENMQQQSTPAPASAPPASTPEAPAAPAPAPAAAPETPGAAPAADAPPASTTA